MPGFLCDYANNRVLDALFGSAAFAPPPTLYLGLATNSANRNGWASEPAGGGYARVPLVNSLENFPAAEAGSKSNSAEVSFPIPTADWGLIRSLFLADAAEGGNVLAMADLAPAKAITGSCPAPWIAPGALHLSHS